VWRPWSWICTTRYPEESNSKSQWQSLRKAAIKNIISDHSSPNLRKTLRAIPAPVIQHQASPISPVEAAGLTYNQRRSFQRKCMKSEGRSGNALTAAAETTKPTYELHTASWTHLIRTPAITPDMTVNKLSAKSHLGCRCKEASLPLGISDSTGKAWWWGIRVGASGKPSHICNLARDTTAPDRLNINGHSGRSGPVLKPIPRQHRETGSGTYHPWSPCTKSTRQHAGIQSTNPLRCNDHVYITEHTQNTRTATQTSVHLHPGSQWPSDDVCKGEPKGKSLGSVFWTPWTRWRISGFSRPSQGIQPVLGLPWFVSFYSYCIHSN